MKISIKIKPRLNEAVDRVRLEKLAQMGDKAAQTDLEKEKERSGEVIDRVVYSVQLQKFTDEKSKFIFGKSMNFHEVVEWIKNNGPYGNFSVLQNEDPRAARVVLDTLPKWKGRPVIFNRLIVIKKDNQPNGTSQFMSFTEQELNSLENAKEESGG